MKLENYYKEEIIGEQHFLLAPPASKVIGDKIILGYNHRPDLMEKDGYTEWTDEAIEAWHKQYDRYTIRDYDDAMENHLLEERVARGYTTREPDYYLNSSVARWKQDAIDWIAHRDAVMLYALDIKNKYAAGEPIPSLEEFKTALPKITWTLEIIESTEPEQGTE